MTEPTAPPPQTEPVATVAPMHRIFTATLILGVPGSGKTTLFKGYAEYLWETYKKVLLLYSWDGGAIPTDVQKRMKQGLIRFWRARTRSAPGLALETLYLASKGYWPRQIHPETGETAPGVDLVAPITTRYHVRCQKGHDLATVPSRSMVVPMYCTPCSAFVPLQELQVTEHAQRTKGFEQVGGVGFDGLTSMTDVVLDHMDLQRGEGLIGGEKAAFGGVVVSGSQKFGGNNRADVGFGQSRGHQFVNNSLGIPYLVEGPVFTALAMEATDEGGLPIVGPKLPGRAATDEASAWFGNVMETGKTPDEQGKQCFTLFLRPFTDAQNRRHLLKTSASPTGVPDRLADPPIEANQPYTMVNLGRVFRMLDDDLRRSLAHEDIGDAPGMQAGMMEYGEAVTATGPALGIVPQQAQGGAVAQGIPPLQVAAPGPTIATPTAVQTPTGAMPPAGAPMMVATPRKRKETQTVALPAAPVATPTPAAPLPLQPLPPVAAAAPVPSSPTVPNTTPATAAATGVAGSVPVAVPSGTTPPPPPGLRPPMKAPGT